MIVREDWNLLAVRVGWGEKRWAGLSAITDEQNTKGVG